MASTLSNQQFPQFECFAGEWINKHVFHLQLNRPSALNAFSPKMFFEFVPVFDFLNQSQDLRVIVFSGNGKAFTAGLDLKQASAIFSPNPEKDPARLSIGTHDLIKSYQKCLQSVADCRVPVIAAIHGHCVGAGVELMSFCDIRYCSKDSKFTVKQVDIGLAADVGSIQRVPNQTGNDSLFRELVYTGQVFGPEEADQLGLISKCFDTKQIMMQNAFKLANTIASKSPVAVWAIKKSLNFDFNQKVTPGLDYIAALNGGMLGTTDISTSVQAFFTKTQPIFPKL